MNIDETLYFERMPSVIPIYNQFKREMKKRYDTVQIRVTKTQISFSNRHIFAILSLPLKKRKGWPEEYLLLSFGLSYRKQSHRIVQAVEAYPDRWTHHVLITSEGEIDKELLEWVEEAYQFSLVK